MRLYPEASENDPDYRDDPSIPDSEPLLRGVLKKHLPKGIGGPVSPAAFKSPQCPKRGGRYRHLSVFCKSVAVKEMSFIWKKMIPRSVALYEVEAGFAREQDHVEGVARCEPHKNSAESHSRIIRNRRASDDEWAVTAVALAHAAKMEREKPASI